MHSRRRFLRALGVLGSALTVRETRAVESTLVSPTPGEGRDYWFEMLQRVASPVLTCLEANELRQKMPVESPGGNIAERSKATHLEAVGRTLDGIAPWFELQDIRSDELKVRDRFLALAHQGLVNATDPKAFERV